MSDTIRRVVVDAGEIVYTLERKTVRNVNLRVRRDGSIAVSAPRRVPLAEIDAFVCSRADFIHRALARFAAAEAALPPPPQYCNGGQVPYLGAQLRIEAFHAARRVAERVGDTLRLSAPEGADEVVWQRMTERFLRAECRRFFPEVVAVCLSRLTAYDVPMPEVRVRAMTSRWGSCMPTKGVITLNACLIAAPIACIEYVAMHELVHFIAPDHSARFYAVLDVCMPDWRARKELLERTVRITA